MKKTKGKTKVEQKATTTAEALQVTTPAEAPKATTPAKKEPKGKTYAQVLQEGYDKGKKDGLELGKKDGFELGRAEGYESGRKKGYQVGHKDGHRDGYRDGNRDGYEAGFYDGTITRGRAFVAAIEAKMAEHDGYKDPELWRREKTIPAWWIAVLMTLWDLPKKGEAEKSKVLPEAVEETGEE